ncbi:response regulator [Pseudoflavitalea rhizosphaerae]|uniref:response regulator n=1 Tax=Pseudoflavitalea rhizosphaerae TaxID=1884793 RepID=UPI000F8D3AFD|nr:response regulator transcription factor [Pseudoflavitalea rhizosphaerae]
MKKIYVAHADDHNLFIRGVKTVLKPFEEIEIVITANNGKELLIALEKSIYIDIVLLDIQMPILDGIALLPILRENYPKIKIIMLTMHNDLSIIKKCQDYGVAGYLTKNASVSDIVLAIVAVMEGQFFFPDTLRIDYLY